MLYDQYAFAKENIHDDLQFDMIKRIENYRKNVDLFNSYGLSKPLKTVPPQSVPSNKL
jgi:hypothetical protein